MRIAVTLSVILILHGIFCNYTTTWPPKVRLIPRVSLLGRQVQRDRIFHLMSGPTLSKRVGLSINQAQTDCSLLLVTEAVCKFASSMQSFCAEQDIIANCAPRKIEN